MDNPATARALHSDSLAGAGLDLDKSARADSHPGRDNPVAAARNSRLGIRVGAVGGLVGWEEALGSRTAGYLTWFYFDR